MEIVQQVLAGKVNKDLVAKLRGRGVGLCGMDGTRIASGLFVSSIPFFGTRKIPTWKQGLALTKKLQKRLVFAVSEALFTTQTPCKHNIIVKYIIVFCRFLYS